MSAAPRVQLADVPERAGRTTATLLASLMARLAALHTVTGSAAIGSLTAGFVALGRSAARTAEGARLRRAIEAGRAGANGERLFRALHLEDWLRGVPASPVLDQLRNDVALLLAPDLEEALGLMPMPGETGMDGSVDEDPAFPDLVLGLYLFSRELVQSVDAIVASSLPPAGAVEPPAVPREAHGPLLR